MAKVLISIPDELLDRLDRHVRQRGITRSGLLRELAERELTRDDVQRRNRIDELLSRARQHGGTSAADIRRFRTRR
jgi:metal-responsive CopG/Arc/MetJ family transcriptional regulator